MHLNCPPPNIHPCQVHKILIPSQVVFLSTSWTFHLSLLTIIRQNHTKGWHASKAICERKFDGEQSLAFNCFPNCFLLSEIWGERRGWEIVSKLLLFIESEFLWNIFGANIILWSWNSEVKKSDRVSLFHLFTLLEEWSRGNTENSVCQSGTSSSNMGAVQASERRQA